VASRFTVVHVAHDGIAGEGAAAETTRRLLDAPGCTSRSGGTLQASWTVNGGLRLSIPPTLELIERQACEGARQMGGHGASDSYKQGLRVQDCSHLVREACAEL
jgi:hypothetical protein